MKDRILDLLNNKLEKEKLDLKTYVDRMQANGDDYNTYPSSILLGAESHYRVKFIQEIIKDVEDLKETK